MVGVFLESGAVMRQGAGRRLNDLRLVRLVADRTG
jgi:hypothetical protein